MFFKPRTKEEQELCRKVRELRKELGRISFILEHIPQIVRCKDCKHLRKRGKITYCVGDSSWRQVFEDDYCSYGERKEQNDDTKITCKECKHLMFSDCYGECNKSLRIVKPDDTCKYAERKEQNNGIENI